MPARLPEITIVRDTREHVGQGWIFEPEEKKPGRVRILGTAQAGLDAADYAIGGYEDLVRIERKAGICELFGNMIPREHKDRFEREMERLEHVKHKYLIIEDSISNDILGLSVPQMLKGPPASSVVKWLFELEIQYGITPIFAGNCGKRVARYIFESIARKYL